MTNQIINQGVKKLHNRNGTFLLFIAIMAVAAGLLPMGCAGQSATAEKGPRGPVDKLYEVSEQEALNLAQWAVGQALPDQKVQRLKKPRLGFLVHETVQPGIVKYARFKEAVFIYEIDLHRMEGSTAQGQGVVGYTYAVKGDGDLKTGPDSLVRLEQKLMEAFEQTGRAVAVAASRPHEPTSIAPAVMSTSKPAKPEPMPVEKATTGITSDKPAVKEAPAVVVPIAPAPVKEAHPAKDEDVFTKLKKLKELRDQEIITEEEFQSKKKELLDRI